MRDVTSFGAERSGGDRLQLRRGGCVNLGYLQPWDSAQKG